MRIKTHYFGQGSLQRLIEVLAFYKPSNVFVLTGKASFEASGVKSKLEAIFDLFQMNAIYFSDFEKNPKIEDVYKGVALLKKANAQLVIAIGGGSVLDIAKLINIFAQSRNRLEPSGQATITTPGIPLIAIPTTAGTGSEATHFSVLYINKEKHSIAHQMMMPNHTIIDPELTFSASAYLTATTGFDAFTQAIESYWSVNATHQSQRYAHKAMRLCLQYLLPAVRGDTHARIQMALAAHLAGRAINISKTTAPHALSYALTMHYGVDHGHAVALTMPLFIQINAAYAKNLLKLFQVDSAKACALKFKDMMQAAGLSTQLRDVGVKDKKDFEFLVQSVNLERMKNNPVHITQQALLEQLLQC